MRIVVALSFAALAACGSSEKKTEPPPEDEVVGDERPDPSWKQQRLGVFVCDTYLGLMASCREQLPVEAHGAFDKGMKNVLTNLRAVAPSDLPYACDMADQASRDALGPLCPGVWPAPADTDG